MKKFLKDLEAELNKFKISKEEIKEILDDHKEMLTEATNEGLTDDEIALKFGDPQKLARELYEDVLEERVSKKAEPVFGTDNLKDYELINSFSVVEDLKAVNISLVNEDVIYFPYEGDSIEVYAKGKFEEEKYTINYKDGNFNLLRSKRSNGFSFFERKNPDFGVRVPKGKLESFKLNLVSGDGEVDEVNATELDFKSVSGDISANNLVTPENITISVVSGDINLQSVNAKGLTATMVSGDLNVVQGSFEELIKINTVSGDANVKDVKGTDVDFHTVSGDLNGIELYCDAVTLKSVSGDLMIINDNKDHKIEVKKSKGLSGKVTIK